MNIQTEQLENHTARLTVEVEPERLDAAKKAAARKIASQVRIPGFRKGKAPYNILLNYVGEAAILEEAVENLGNEIYGNALDESEVQPYGPGSLEDFQTEPQPVFKFIVPLQPTVDLGDYRDVRLDFEAPEVTDEDVDKALKALQEREAEVTESSEPVAAGNRVTMSIKGVFLDSVADDDSEADDADAEDSEATPAENEVFINNDSLVFDLTPDEEPAPGFTDALVGAVVDEEREFELTYPDDEEEFQHLAGRQVKFSVTVKKIETVTLPELDDAFAARLADNEAAPEDAPQTLEALRAKVRQDLEESAAEQAENEYSQQVLEKIIEAASFSYPDALVSDQVHHILHHMDQDLRQRGLTLDDYMKITGKSHDDLHDDYNESAIETIKRSLAIRELIDQEKLGITDSDVDAEIDRAVAQFGEQAEAIRSIYNSPEIRQNVMNDLVNRKVMSRIASIAKGENPEIETIAEDDTAPATDDTVTEVDSSSEEG